MDVKNILLKKIKDGTFFLRTDTEIAKLLKLNKQQAYGLRDILHALVREGELLCDSRYRYGTAEQFHAKTGRIQGNERGFAFFLPDDGSEDIFIPARRLNGALHADTVLAIITDQADASGEVLAVITRGLKEFVGTYSSVRGGGYVKPDERKLDLVPFVSAQKSKQCKNGDKVVVKITSYDRKKPLGEVVEIIGRSGDFFTEENALIRSHNLRENFDNELLKEAEHISHKTISAQGRLDLRDALIITVDGEDTRDIDDAISIEKKDGKYFLGVHIADVSSYVMRGSLLDGEAFQRGTSVYFPDRVLPMLPPALSNGICSLNEGVERLTLSCLMTVDQNGRVLQKRIAPSVIVSKHRMTYTDVTKIYENDARTVEKYPDLVDFVNTAIELTNILKTAREKRGGVALDIKEAKILYEDGKISIPDYDRSVSHEMIEQFMVLANESVATIMTEMGMPFVYRIHEQPSPEKADEFKTFLREIGIHAKFDPENVTPADYSALLESLEGSPVYSLVNRIMLRSMMKARYAPENKGHFGLASDCYCHFTSPIRRYPDLCIHRIIKDALTDKESARKRHERFVSEASIRSSACEKNAQEAERDVDALYIVKYMNDKIGEEYDATISGITAYGLFCELENTVEGFIPVDALPDDYYDFIEEKFVLRGTRQSFRLGQSVRVMVVGVDWGLRRVYFNLV